MNGNAVRKANIKGDWIIYIPYLAEKALEGNYNMNPSSVLKIQQGLWWKQNPAETSYWKNTQRTGKKFKLRIS